MEFGFAHLHFWFFIIYSGMAMNWMAGCWHLIIHTTHICMYVRMLVLFSHVLIVRKQICELWMGMNEFCAANRPYSRFSIPKKHFKDIFLISTSTILLRLHMNGNSAQYHSNSNKLFIEADEIFFFSSLVELKIAKKKKKN